jgi:hypothetical protein
VWGFGPHAPYEKAPTMDGILAINAAGSKPPEENVAGKIVVNSSFTNF